MATRISRLISMGTMAVAVRLGACELSARSKAFDLAKLSDPKKFGEAHNKAFQMLAEKTSGRGTETPEEMLELVREDMIALRPNVASHEVMVDEMIELAMEKVGSGKRPDTTYPSTFSDERKDVLDRAFFRIRSLDEDNLSATVKELDSLLEEAENLNDGASFYDSYITIAALSVAKSSAELWYGVDSEADDPTSRALRETSGRHLQGYADECTNWVIIADVISFFAITPPGTIVAWLLAIPFLLPIVLPTLGLTSPLVFLFLIPFFAMFLASSVLFSFVGFYFDVFQDTCSFTDAPSVSSKPSSVPSLPPSDAPSVAPSAAPSTSRPPSDAPSFSPSDVPSNAPSSVPSDAPSFAPSLSSAPSNVPSDAPSSVPSDVPSDAPSSVPSDVPSDAPSLSSAPSNVPSDAPSSVPSDVPSDCLAC